MFAGQGVFSLFQGLVDERDHIANRTRLFNVIEGVMLAGHPGGVGTAVAGVHDHLNLGPYLFEFFQCLDTIHSWHLLIQDDYFRVCVAHNFYGIFPTARIQHMKVSNFKLLRQGLAKTVLIVDQEDQRLLFMAGRCLFLTLHHGLPFLLVEGAMKS